jgi:CRP-like cAMP-binding protein
MANKRTLGFSSTVFRKKFRAGMTVRNYRDNKVILSQGDAADEVFYIQSGTVKLTVAATRRKKAIIAVLLRGSFFGEGCLGGQSLRIYTARSIGQSSSPVSLACGRKTRFAHSNETRNLQRCLLHTCFPALFELRKTW